MAIIAGIAAVGFAILVAIMRFDNGRATVLPNPTGAFPVGRTSWVLADSNATEVMAPGRGSTRKLYLWAWYPRIGRCISEESALSAAGMA